VVGIVHHRFPRRPAPGKPHIGRAGARFLRLVHHLDGSFIHLDHRPGQELRLSCSVFQRLEREIRLLLPIGHVLPADPGPKALKALFLAVVRQMIDEFILNDEGQKLRGHNALRDDGRRNRGNAEHRVLFIP
jgi:hypothetical protein